MVIWLIVYWTPRCRNGGKRIDGCISYISQEPLAMMFLVLARRVPSIFGPKLEVHNDLWWSKTFSWKDKGSRRHDGRSICGLENIIKRTGLLFVDHHILPISNLELIMRSGSALSIPRTTWESWASMLLRWMTNQYDNAYEFILAIHVQGEPQWIDPYLFIIQP